jgi:hypothetical protein
MFAFKFIFRLIGALGLVLVLEIFAAPRVVSAANCTWSGATGNWSQKDNWSCNQVPGAGDTANIYGGTVTLDGGVIIKDLNFGGGTLQGGSLEVTSSMNWANCAVMIGTGETDIDTSATLTITTGVMGCYGSTQSVPILNTRTLHLGGTTLLLGKNSLNLQTGATILNTGLFDVQDDAGLWHSPGDVSTSVINSGTFRKSNGGNTSLVFDVLFNNTGTVEAQTGTLRLAGGGTSSGSFSAQQGATLDFGGGTQVITLTAPGSISGAGTIGFGDGTTTISGSGTYSVGNTAIGGGTLNLNLDGTTANLYVGYGTLQGSGTLTVTSTADWSGCSFIAGTGATTIASNATLTITTGMTGCHGYTQSVPILDTRTLNVAGTANLKGTNSLVLQNGATILNTGIFDIQDDAGLWHNPADAKSSSVSNSGTFRKSNGVNKSLVFDILFTNTGTVQAQSGILSFSNFTQTNGVTVLNGGTLESYSAPLTFNGGTLQGAGTINGNVTNTGGTVSPGSSPGKLHIAGNYSQGAAGKLNIELGGNISVEQYDLLDVTGTATLSGTLNVSLINNFKPVTGDAFRIINFSNRSGDFVTETGLSVGGWLTLLPVYSSDHLSLNAVVTHKVYIPMIAK